ncbi:MAG: M23 family metallopeptidase [Cyanobacteria bacterium P01_F01_bin.150]
MKRQFSRQPGAIQSTVKEQSVKPLTGQLRFGWSMVVALGLLGSSVQPGVTVEATDTDITGCPPSVIDQMTTHELQTGETLESVATVYGLLPGSIMAVNPSIQRDALTVGDRLNIPPHNGALYAVPSGTTWQELADQFGIRADVLFESNGCGVTPPNQVFVPGLGGQVTSGLATQSAQPEPLTFNSLPLQNGGAIALGYGWQQPSADVPATFHSGLDFEAAMGSTVISVAEGTVAFAGERGSYGKLVVINHERGVQTRYAQLSDITVELGDAVGMGEQIGLSGQSGSVTAPHLHFEVRLNSPSGWIAQDPYLYLNTLD